MGNNAAHLAKIALGCLCIAAVSACGGGGGGDTTDPPVIVKQPPPVPPPTAVDNLLSGSVGDGPIVDGRVRIYDDRSQLVADLRSDASATYRRNVRVEGVRYPLRLEAREGTDLVTGGPPDFTLVSVAMRPAQRTVSNINPHSTLIVGTALKIAPGPTDNAIASARTSVVEQLNFGLDSRLIGDPVTSPIDADNIAAMVKSSEALGEMVRRTRDALIGTGVTDANAVVAALVADLADGVVDGRGTAGASARVAAVSHLAGAQVLLESLVNELHVNGVLATAAMDDAIRQTVPEATMLTDGVVSPAPMLAQTAVALEAAVAFTGDPLLESTAAAVADLPVDILAADVQGRLPAGAGAALQAAIDAAVLADETGLELINRTVRKAEAATAGMPRISFDTASTSVAEGATVEVTVRRDSGAGAATVEWRTRSGTAQAGDDFRGQVGRTVSFADGQTSKTVSVETLADGLTEGDETFVIELSGPTGALLGTPTTVEVVLLDGGAAGVFTLGTNDMSVIEGGEAQLTVRRSSAEVAATVSWETVDGSATATTDYVAIAPGTLSFAAGETTRTVSITTVVDGAAEGEETFSVRLFAPSGGASLGTPATATIRLLDQNTPPPPNDYYPPELVSASVAGDAYLLSWRHPQHPPEGGYDIIVDGNDSNTAWRTMALTATIETLDSSLRHCFMVEARYPSDNEFRRSNEICVEPPAGVATLSWTPPTQRVDGSALDNLAGYEVHYGQDPTRPDRMIVLDDPGLTTYVMDRLGQGTWQFAMRAYDADGRRSALSTLGSKTFP